MTVEELAEEIGCKLTTVYGAAKAFGLYLCSPKTQVSDSFVPAIRKQKLAREQARQEQELAREQEILERKLAREQTRQEGRRKRKLAREQEILERKLAREQARREQEPVRKVARHLARQGKQFSNLWTLAEDGDAWETVDANRVNTKSFDVQIPFVCCDRQRLPLPGMIDTAEYWNTSDVPDELGQIPPLPEDCGVTTDSGKLSFAETLWRICEQERRECAIVLSQPWTHKARFHHREHRSRQWGRSRTWAPVGNHLNSLNIVVVTTHDGVVYLQHLKVRHRPDRVVLRLDAVTVLSRNGHRHFVSQPQWEEKTNTIWNHLAFNFYCRERSLSRYKTVRLGRWWEKDGYPCTATGFPCTATGFGAFRDPVPPDFEECAVYRANLQTAFQKPGFYFDPWKLFRKRNRRCIRYWGDGLYAGGQFFQFLATVTYPAFEIVEKAGFDGAQWFKAGRGLLDPCATNLRDAFGLNIREIGEIRERGYSFADVWFYKCMKARKTPVSWTVARFFASEVYSFITQHRWHEPNWNDPGDLWLASECYYEIGDSYMRDVMADRICGQVGKTWMEVFCGTESLLVFLSEISGRDSTRFFTWLHRDNMRIRDYFDYLDECLTLGLDIKNRDVVAPKHPMEAHRRTSMIIAQQRARELEEQRQAWQAREAEQEAQRQHRLVNQDEQIAKAIRRNIPAVLVNGAFESGAYRATVARGNADLIAESMALGHCVGTGGYANEMSRGSSFIFFVRRRESSDTPFFTMQLSPDFRILQLRGRFNCAPPQDVKVFASEFTAWLRCQEKPVIENAA
ncbi:MAG: PcfJ domain-containing protein [Acidobacteriota bacterium]|jgi:hypothetical protein|nr:PcfJ domain-containing protein [Acidobacteriota bacterium]